MYESNNKKVEKIVNLIQSHGCIIEGKKISLDDLPLLCQDLNDSDKKEVADLIQSIDDELFHLYGERQYLNDLTAYKQFLSTIVKIAILLTIGLSTTGNRRVSSPPKPKQSLRQRPISHIVKIQMMVLGQITWKISILASSLIKSSPVLADTHCDRHWIMICQRRGFAKLC
jgi:hypothetical protein